jgi:hypothetical protein
MIARRSGIVSGCGCAEVLRVRGTGSSAFLVRRHVDADHRGDFRQRPDTLSPAARCLIVTFLMPFFRGPHAALEWPFVAMLYSRDLKLRAYANYTYGKNSLKAHEVFSGPPGALRGPNRASRGPLFPVPSVPFWACARAEFVPDAACDHRPKVVFFSRWGA